MVHLWDGIPIWFMCHSAPDIKCCYAVLSVGVDSNLVYVVSLFAYRMCYVLQMPQ